jgi:DNA-binding response OmpR family regulator
MTSGRPSVLLVHDEAEMLETLTRWFAASMFEVICAITVHRAQRALEGRELDAIVAAWDSRHPVGAELYRWVLGHRSDLRSRFVFIGDDVPGDFDELVGGRCLTIPAGQPAELLQITTAVVRRPRTPPRGVPIVTDRPALLLADDDPVLLATMGELLDSAGFAVFEAESFAKATAALEARDYHAIVADWRMHDGSGAELYRWIEAHRPHLAPRVVFLSEAAEDDSRPIAPDRAMLRKGQDSRALIDVLQAILDRG